MKINIGGYFSFDFFVLIGQLTVLFFSVSLLACLFLALCIFIYVKTRRVLFPGLFLFLADTLLSPTKTIFRILQLDPEIVDQTIINIRNNIFEEKFRQIPYGDRVIFLPHCLRHKNCPAKLTREGIICHRCGLCVIAEIKDKAELLGYGGLYVVPGSSFIKRLIKKKKPRAILGVGCHIEVREGINMVSSYGIAVQGVLLLKDGCIDTVVDEETVMEKMAIISLQAQSCQQLTSSSALNAKEDCSNVES